MRSVLCGQIVRLPATQLLRTPKPINLPKLPL